MICDFLAQANALTHIDLSSTECFVESVSRIFRLATKCPCHCSIIVQKIILLLFQIFGALIRGCCQNLAHLNLSGNQFTNRKSKDTNLSSSFQQVNFPYTHFGLQEVQHVSYSFFIPFTIGSNKVFVLFSFLAVQLR